MSKPASSIMIIALVLTILIVGVLFFLSYFERKKEQVYTGYRGEAAENDYYAAQQFLRGRNLDVKKIRSMQYLSSPPTDCAAIFLLQVPHKLSSDDLEYLLDWVNKGGLLIIALPLGEYSDSAIISASGFTSDITAAAPASSALETVLLRLKGGQRELKVDVDRQVIFSDKTNSALWTLPQTKGYALVEFPDGKGSVCFSGRPLFMTNDKIAENQNAEFLWYLLRNRGQGNIIWFVDIYRPVSQPNMTATCILVVSLLFFLLMLVWGYLPRFGPQRELGQAVRRSLLEHVYASGVFLWKHKYPGMLLGSSAQDILNRIYKKHPNLRDLKAEYQLLQLQSLSGISINRLRVLFENYSGEHSHKENFHTTIKHMERIRKSI